jgi:hypothetical protein
VCSNLIYAYVTGKRGFTAFSANRAFYFFADINYWHAFTDKTSHFLSGFSEDSAAYAELFKFFLVIGHSITSKVFLNASDA